MGQKEIQDETSVSHQIQGFLQIFSSSNSETFDMTIYDICMNHQSFQSQAGNAGQKIIQS